MSIFTIIVTLLVFMIMIFIHEFGHFIFAKLSKVRVNEFALGMGPALFKKQIGETLYSIRLLPIGGYCKMEGEDEASVDPRAFVNSKLYKRFCIVVAGAVFNIILGFVIFTALAAFEPINSPVISSVYENTAMAESVFEEGDRIIALGGTKIHIYEDLKFFMDRNGDKSIVVTAKRNGKKITDTITPVLAETTYNYNENNIEVISVINGKPLDTQYYDIPENADDYAEYVGKSTVQKSYILGFTATQEKRSFVTVLREGFFKTLYNAKIVYISIYELICGKVPADQISGPVGIIGMIGQVSKVSLSALMSLIGLLTVNLGIMNLLPLPALDGGRLLFIIAEAVTGKPIDPKKEGFIHFIGFAALMCLIIFATYNDIARLIASLAGAR